MAVPAHLHRPDPLTTSYSSSGLNQNPYISSPLASSTVNNTSQNTNPFRRTNTNPFRTPKQSPITSDFPAVFSPVSPIDNRQPVNMSQPRKSVDLRTIDGKPYPGTEDKPRKVKVAQDMYAGDMPPSYDNTGYKAPAEKGEKGERSEKGHKHTASCQKCGGHKKNPSVAATAPPPPPQNIDCNQCGGKRSTPPSSFPGANAAPVRVQPFYPPIQSAEAGPSNARTKSHCTKCGRRKRLESISTSGSNSPQHVSNHRSVPSIQTNGMPVGINIEPPTAITERAPTFSTNSPVGAPLTKNRRVDSLPQGQKSHSRSNSISRLFRSLSGRKKSVDRSSPTQAMPTEASQGSRRSASYTRLHGNDQSRPPSPFSFIDKPQEDQAFEMNDMRRSKLPERRDSWEKSDESTLFLGTKTRPRIGRSQSTTAAKYPGSKPVDDVYLSLPPDQRPGITRFKSLRGAGTKVADGLSRSASQISRSSSLRRLGSVKKVPDLWYREVDGPAAEYNNYGY